MGVHIISSVRRDNLDTFCHKQAQYLGILWAKIIIDRNCYSRHLLSALVYRQFDNYRNIEARLTSMSDWQPIDSCTYIVSICGRKNTHTALLKFRLNICRYAGKITLGFYISPNLKYERKNNFSLFLFPLINTNFQIYHQKKKNAIALYCHVILQPRT